MKLVIQRVKSSAVTINGEETRSIDQGLLILVGIEAADGDEDINWLAKKVVQLRIFNDDEGVMNRNVQDVMGNIMIISQFTLHASTKKGNRPSYIKAAKPEISIPVYNKFVAEVETLMSKKVVTGEFGAHMDISLINDGPVTIIVDSKNKT